MAGIHEGDELVSVLVQLLAGTGQFLVGNGLALVGQKPFNAPSRGGVWIACAVPRKIHKCPRAGLGVAAQLLKGFQNVFFGGLGIDKGFDVLFRNAHSGCNTLGAGHVVGHPAKGWNA